MVIDWVGLGRLGFGVTGLDWASLDLVNMKWMGKGNGKAEWEKR